MSDTVLFQLAFVVYLLVSGIAITLTYREQQSSGISSPLFRLIGFSLCAIWPFTLVLFTSARLLHRA